jgi:GT2 family glycosyltransferase
MPGASETGIVVIGRNEGERLRACLRSVSGSGVPVVYVDSGSSDGSPELAASMGATAVRLDPGSEFSAARARNEGFQRLAEILPALSHVQFVDGDCELEPGWLERASSALAAHPEVAVVCGHVREQHPEASIYNRLCGLEWQKTPGEIPACGGIFMIRAAAFRAVGGFRPDVIAAEDDELCLRLRRAGGRIVLLDARMALHDAAMTRFAQWWRRALRAGHAYAQGSALHGRGPDRHFVRDCRRIWFWGLALPFAAVALACLAPGPGLGLLALYPLQVLRIHRAGRRRGWSRRDAALYAVFAVLSKFPGLAGLLEFHMRRWRGRPMAIIEHKEVGTSP